MPKSAAQIWKENLLQVAIDNAYEQLLERYANEPLSEFRTLFPGFLGSCQKYDPAIELSELAQDRVPYFATAQKFQRTVKKSLIASKFRRCIAKPNELVLYDNPYGMLSLDVERAQLRGVPRGRIIRADTARETELDSSYLRYLLKSRPVLQYVLTQCGTIGVGPDFVRVKKCPIPLPPLDVQEKVVEYLEVIEAASASAATFQKDWLSGRGFTRVEDMHKDVLQNAIDNVYEKLLTSSTSCRLDACTLIVNGVTSGGQYENSRSSFDTRSVRVYSLSEVRQHEHPERFTIASRVGGFAQPTDCCIFNDPYGNGIDTDFLPEVGVPGGWTLQASDIILPKYLKFILRAETIDRFLSVLARTRGMLVDTARIPKCPIPLPSLSIQQQVVSYLTKIEEASKELKAKQLKNNATAKRDSYGD